MNFHIDFQTQFSGVSDFVLLGRVCTGQFLPEYPHTCPLTYHPSPIQKSNPNSLFEFFVMREDKEVTVRVERSV